ncbi:hypothetical protein BG011_002305 [Mortierella polycephala]|uniref:Uncharacterized protein n=1 Tax=Mortierella polycephala TaxID=41804 RepID=A0A9P6U4X6_9FUNG|nr:hypothetical protein BG011_002305 [Mortierella polycephala]
MNLAPDKVPACVIMNLEAESCIFTPSRPGTGFSFSTISASGKEIFSGTFAAGGSYPAMGQGNSVTGPKSSMEAAYRPQPMAAAHKVKLTTEAMRRRRALHDMAGYMAL